MMIGIAETEAGSGPPVDVEAEPELRASRDQEAKTGRLRWRSIILAALLYAVVVAAFLIDWPFTFVRPLAPPPAIPVTLVMAPPPAPPKPVPKPTPQQPPPQHFYDLRSGADQETTAPPSAEAKGEEAAPKPEPPPATAETSEPAQAKPQHPTPPATPKPKEAARSTGADPSKQVALNVRPGDKERSGDPYLNAISARVEQHRSYPANAVGNYGLRLQGTVVMEVAVLPSGALAGMRVARSSGSAVLDQTAQEMIERSAPFPPLPDNYPREGVIISWTLPIYPPEP